MEMEKQHQTIEQQHQGEEGADRVSAAAAPEGGRGELYQALVKFASPDYVDSVCASQGSKQMLLGPR
jgi:hypothetical protein